MNDRPSLDLSIVIVSWNTLEITRDCLRSVEAHRGGLALEVFLVDNASSDGSADMVAAEFPQVVLIRNDANLGFAAANNQALAIARGRHSLLLNSDTVVLGDVLQKSVRYVDEHPDVGVFGCRVLNPDRTMQSTCFSFPSLLNLLLKTSGLFRLPWPRFFGREHLSHWKRDTERDVDVVTGCYMLVRGAAMEQVGLLDDTFFFCGEETDWCRRFRAAGWRVRFAPVGEIVHLGNASGRKLSARRDQLLTTGLVRYHRKYNGLHGALAAYTVHFVFQLARYLLWALAALVRRDAASRERRDHFGVVLREYRSTWVGG
jgi:GT2 family glycosyltransferase